MPRTWYTRRVRGAVAVSGRTPFAAYGDVAAAGVGGAIVTAGAGATVAARRPAEWHRRRPTNARTNLDILTGCRTLCPCRQWYPVAPPPPSPPPLYVARRRYGRPCERPVTVTAATAATAIVVVAAVANRITRAHSHTPHWCRHGTRNPIGCRDCDRVYRGARFACARTADRTYGGVLRRKRAHGQRASRARHHTNPRDTRKLTTRTRRAYGSTHYTPVDLTPRAHAHTQTAD